MVGFCLAFYKPNFGKIQKKDKLKIGYMPQSINVINTMPMTVKNFITVRKKYDDISFKQVVSEIDIRQLVDKQLSVLSGWRNAKGFVGKKFIE